MARKKTTNKEELGNLVFNYAVDIISSSPIYSYKTIKFDNFMANMKHLKRYLDSNLKWKVKVGSEEYEEEFNSDNYQNMLDRYSDGDGFSLFSL